MRQPEITITFTELGASAIKRGERGIIAMILKSDTNEGPFSFDKSTNNCVYAPIRDSAN